MLICYYKGVMPNYLPAMKRLLKILLTTLIILLISFFGTKMYLKYSVKQTIGEQNLNDLIEKINSAPPLPQNFKYTYSKVYPAIFKDSFTTYAIKSILRQTGVQSPPSRQIANHCRTLFSNDSHFDIMLNHFGLMWLIEDKVSQEKCFEYNLAHTDFLYNTKGPYEAAIFYYKKPLDSLTIEEQLGMILLIKNPVIFNKVRSPDRHENAVKKLKEKITG
jgi:hypothetical protein